MIGEEFLWVEKYRPRTIDDCILPANLKKTFKDYVAQGSFQHLLLTGTAGVGKTTIARALCNELEMDVLMINGSLEGREIDTLRSGISKFASSVSLVGNKKCVILDEADYLNAQSFQPALRAFMEEFSGNCVFILTCNFKNRIIEPLHSRCTTIEFKITKKEMQSLAGQFLKRAKTILTDENVEFDQAVVANLIMKHLPDWRRVLNSLQRYGVGGVIDAGILANVTDSAFSDLMDHMKGKRFSQVRKWIVDNSDIDSAELYRLFYDTAVENIQPQTIPMLVMNIARYQYQEAFVADREINTAAFLAEVMQDCLFK